MIYDTLENLELYKGLDKNLDTAIRYILTHELADLPAGRTDIDGDQVYVLVSEPEPRSEEQADFELHKNYIDLQIDLAGSELFQAALGETQVTKPYDAAADCCLVKAAPSSVGTLCEGRFVLFWAMEPHKPALRAAAPGKLKKAVFKIRDKNA